MTDASNRQETVEHWDRIHVSMGYSRHAEMHVLGPAMAHFGDVRGKTVLDFGCGLGAASLFFASRGANVIAVDISPKAIADLNETCAREGISNLRAVCMSAMSVDQLPPVDFVYGSMILHHIEPFDGFAARLRKALKPGGRGFFYENNAISSVLIWFREHVVGKLWVPKYGDREEFPLTPGEIDVLRRHFTVEIEIPEMLFFALASQYLLRGVGFGAMQAFDAFLYRRRWGLRYSYRQFVKLS
jgi:2-polyprenyl-3-methyl-5-hydroxy-6-metoxy-1,4-benzoquinol methylase